MQDFIKNYPPLSQEELSNLGDERCCICWEDLSNRNCSRISCGHVHHIDCIRTWVLNNEKKCPLCKQVFFQAEASQEKSFIWNLLFSRNSAGRIEEREREIEQVRQILPHIPHEIIRRELERTGSMDETIANMFGDE